MEGEGRAADLKRFLDILKYFFIFLSKKKPLCDFLLELFQQYLLLWQNMKNACSDSLFRSIPFQCLCLWLQNADQWKPDSRVMTNEKLRN